MYHFMFNYGCKIIKNYVCCVIYRCIVISLCLLCLCCVILTVFLRSAFRAGVSLTFIHSFIHCLFVCGLKEYEVNHTRMGQE